MSGPVEAPAGARTVRQPLASLQGVLWDFDGTLADSEQLWMQAEFELIPVWADDPDIWNLEHAKRMIGNSLIESGRYIVSVIGRTDLSPMWVMDRLSERMNELLAGGEVPWMPGALELLAALRTAHVPCALVSASFRPTLRIVTSRLPEGSFAAVVAGDEVDRGKPHPEPYLRGARLLGVDPRRCVAIEDSIPGATSGNAAGAVVLAVRNHVNIPPAPRRVLVETLRGVTPADLDRHVTEADDQGPA